MRQFNLAALWLAAMPVMAEMTPAYADANLPVCAQTYGKGDGISCNYANYEQCRAFVSGLAGSCIDNPYYRASSNSVRPRKRVGS